MKVLIVDDNEELTDAVKDFLDSISIECKVKNEGEEGLNEILLKKEHMT
jgi:DNA-binding response OmpR family regulator